MSRLSTHFSLVHSISLASHVSTLNSLIHSISLASHVSTLDSLPHSLVSSSLSSSPVSDIIITPLFIHSCLLLDLLLAGLREAGIVFTQWSKNRFFAPQGRHARCPDKREIWHGAVPNFTFVGAKMWEYSPQNCQNFEFLP